MLTANAGHKEETMAHWKLADELDQIEKDARAWKNLTDGDLAAAVAAETAKQERRWIALLHKIGWFDKRMTNAQATDLLRYIYSRLDDERPPRPSRLQRLKWQVQVRERMHQPTLEPWRSAKVSRATYYRRRGQGGGTRARSA